MRFQAPKIESTRNDRLRDKLVYKLSRKTKPQGALGQLEALALDLCLIQLTDTPAFHAPQAVVFGADHGVATMGVSAYPQAVTAQMMRNMLDGGAAISVFARQHGFALTVVDGGVMEDLPDHPQLVKKRLALGTGNFAVVPAMNGQQACNALQAGCDVIRALPGNVVAVGEIGIGNTSSAALVAARMLDAPLAKLVGAGTGLDQEGLARKQLVLENALAHHPRLDDPLGVLATFGGFEIGMMAGAFLQAASERRVILVDGFVASAALLLAAGLEPTVRDYCVFAHRSAEPGHRLVLDHFKALPLLDLEMRLGEGTGALLAWPLVESAAAFMREMASFESAGVSRRVRSR
jgi:nicotinate-nucleotide--dimethylbenzimidazole phosphoribosyltransferase